MFSVVIPLYNKELSIGNTIQSVLDQTYQEFEIVVVNDGSTDNSLQIVEQINDPRIRIINKPNEGVSSARNRGIKEAKYEWIAFLDGDDLWKINHLEEVVRMMSIFPEEKVFATSFEYSDKREIFRHKRSESIFKVENYFRDAIEENLIWTSVVVIHKSCFVKSGQFNEKLIIGEDIELWARIMKNFILVKSSLITATYRIEAENRSMDRKKFPMKNSMYSMLDFSKMNTNDEKKYFKKFIIDKLKSFILKGDIKNIIYIIFRYKFNLL